MITNYMVLFCVLLMTVSCGARQQYDITIENVGDETIDDAHVIFEGFYSIGGIIPPGREATNLRPNHRLPEVVLVQWQTEDYVLHKKIIKIDLPPKFKGDIRFKIGAQEKVTVQYIPWD